MPMMRVIAGCTDICHVDLNSSTAEHGSVERPERIRQLFHTREERAVISTAFPPTFAVDIRVPVVGGVGSAKRDFACGSGQHAGCTLDCLWVGERVAYSVTYDDPNFHIFKTCIIPGSKLGGGWPADDRHIRPTGNKRVGCWAL